MSAEIFSAVCVLAGWAVGYFTGWMFHKHTR